MLCQRLPARINVMPPRRNTSGFDPSRTVRSLERYVSNEPESRLSLDIAKATRMTLMYGPAVRRKRFWSRCRLGVLHQCIRPLIGARQAPGHHGYQRACDLISGQASTGPFGSPVFACAGKTEPPSHLILSQTSAGKSGNDYSE
jgi:hypothetical protein